jgi:arylsulfatase A-like enzyme
MRLLAALFLLVAGLPAVAGATGPVAAGERPNVVLILIDNQGYGDIAALGNPVVKTPALDRLHGESVRLTDYHVDPTCSPTRAALLTGFGWSGDAKEYPYFNAGMRGWKSSEYDGGHRVPLFIHWPAGGVAKGRDVDALAGHIDLLPTLLELCGLPPIDPAHAPPPPR